MRTTFLSYRRRDSREATRAIFAALAGEFGSQHVFRDVDSIPAGVDFRAVIEDEIVRSDVMLVVIGPQWLQLADAEGRRLLDLPGDFVRAEISRALESKLPVVGVLVDGAAPPAADQLPAVLQPLARCPFAELIVADAAIEQGLPQLFNLIRATPKSTRGLTVRERYAAGAARAWQAALTTTLIATLGGITTYWLDRLGWNTTWPYLMLFLAALLGCGIAVGWRGGRWWGALLGAMLLPLATASAVALSLLCALAPLVPFAYVVDSSSKVFVTALTMVIVASPVGNLSGLYGLKRAAVARAHRRRVSGAVLWVVGWWLLGVGAAYLLAGAAATAAQRLGGTAGNIGENTLLYVGGWATLATPLGALLGFAWQWTSGGAAPVRK
jgi:hypothetical protein